MEKPRLVASEKLARENSPQIVHEKLSPFETFEVLFGSLVLFVLAILLGLALASSSFMVIFNINATHARIDSEVVTIPLAELHHNAQRTLDFVRGATNRESIKPAIASMFSYDELEISHLEDVEKLLRPALLALIPVAALALLFLIRGFFGSKARVLYRVLIGGLTLTVASIGSLFIIGTLSFSSLFTTFHEVLFPQGNWTFASDSLLIMTFPLNFWINEALIIFAGIMLTCLLYLLLVFVLKEYVNSCV